MKLPRNKVTSGSNDKTIKIWDTITGNCLKTILGHTDKVYCIDKLNENQIISGSKDNTIRIWDI